jgi:hypothetical protein
MFQGETVLKEKLNDFGLFALANFDIPEFVIVHCMYSYVVCLTKFTECPDPKGLTLLYIYIFLLFDQRIWII